MYQPLQQRGGILSNLFFFSAGLDYIAVDKILTFEPSATVQTLKVVILDDLGLPKVEGKEEFELILRMPVNAKLGTQRTTLISINDSTSDCEFQTYVFLQY